MTDTAALKLMLEHRAAIEAEWQALALQWLPRNYPPEERDALADGGRARTEVLWINQAADDGAGLFATTLK